MKLFIKNLLLASIFPVSAAAQCDTTYLSGNQTVNADAFMSGVYYVDGDFTLNAGATIYVQPFTSGGCGKLEIHAANLNISGIINGDFAGNPGGNPGNGATAVNSITGDMTALNSCSNKDNAGKVDIEGGKAGTAGLGSGGGLQAQNGTSGSGPKQVCETSADTYGMIPGSGGAGAGGGGSYGGAGTAGGNGGNGSGVHTAAGVSVSGQYTVLPGTGGNGGNAGTPYGTQYEEDIDLGSGGAGSGGGGRSYDAGMTGLRGGNGGGLVVLVAEDELQVSGSVSVNGENGKLGGNAGSGGATDKCCSDGCNDCGEATFSAGAGGGSGSGAGSGGGILLKAGNAAQISGTLSATGGNGGNAGSAGSGTTCSYSATFCGTQDITTGAGQTGGIGGNGSGGRIKVFVPICASSQIDPVTHINGGTNAGVGTYAEICGNLGLDEAEEVKFSVFPNPVADMLHVTLISNTTDLSGNLQLIDAFGREVQTVEIDGTEMNINTADLTSGLYMLNLTVNGRLSVMKILKK